MPTLRREDGAQFVIRPYRELFDFEKSSLIKRKIRELAKKQGENVRLFRRNDNRIEAVFSREPGFLLGETLWFYLDKPDNLIYCEQLPERRFALIVVVRNGAVFLDAKISFTNLLDELISLSIGDDKYDIYVHGDVPIAKESGGGKFAFNAQKVKSFHDLEEPLLAKLPIDENAQLQPLELALSSPYLGKTKYWSITIGIVAVVFVIVLWHVFTTKPDVEVTLYKPKQVVSPYLGYYQALTTPAPRRQINELISVIETVRNLPGWKIGNLVYSGNRYNIQITSTGGQISQAQSWAEVNKINATLGSNGMTLTIASQLKNRAKPASIYPLERTLALLVDELRQIMANQKVTYSGITSYNQYKSATVTINFDKVFFGELMVIGEELNRFPVTINQIKITTKDNLFSGSINLQVLGD